MTTNKFITKLLKLKGLKVTWYEFKERKKELWLARFAVRAVGDVWPSSCLQLKNNW